jgi:hypothetical protein
MSASHLPVIIGSIAGVTTVQLIAFMWGKKLKKLAWQAMVKGVSGG